MQQVIERRPDDTRVSPQTKLGLCLCHLIYPFGGARLYTGEYGLGIAQTLVTLVTCGVGGLWPILDGFIMLGSTPRDRHGRAILGGGRRQRALLAEAEAAQRQLPPPDPMMQR